ncbi:CrmD [Cowpox virus]|uniref:CrmD n=1 Tax=Cowpox virus TaxID=10243 RepID=U5TDK4_COWPX|nr:CrmD [Cowpox virus]AGY98461.1 CrmD [Cowpox virus]AGY98677.1 CrmD [Cowpox virus]AGY99951.1 CrmD [Cowpox virus]
MMKMTPSYILLVYMFVVVSGDVPYEHINGKCNGTDYNSNSNNLCCKQCDPGMYMTHSCNTTSNTKCDKCPDDTFTSIPNHIPTCLSCRGKCSSNQVETKSCSNTQAEYVSVHPDTTANLKDQTVAGYAYHKQSVILVTVYMATHLKEMQYVKSVRVI